MKNQKWLLLVIALALIAGTAGALNWLRANQKLGKPGIKAVAIPVIAGLVFFGVRRIKHTIGHAEN